MTTQNSTSKTIKEANALLQLNKFKEAIELAEPYLYSNPENIELLKILSRSYYRIREYEKGLPLVFSIYQTAKNEATINDALCNISLGLREIGKPNESLKFILKLLEKNNSNPYFHSEAMHCYLEIKDIKSAEDHLNRCLSLMERLDYRTSSVLLIHVAWFYIEVEEFSKSIEFLKKLLDIYPIDMDGLQSMGDSYYNLKMFREAKDYYKKVKLYYPDTVQAEWASRQIIECEEWS